MPEPRTWQIQALAPYAQQTELWATWDRDWPHDRASIRVDVRANVLVVESADRALLAGLLERLAAMPMELELSLMRTRLSAYQEAVQRAQGHTDPYATPTEG